MPLENSFYILYVSMDLYCIWGNFYRLVMILTIMTLACENICLLNYLLLLFLRMSLRIPFELYAWSQIISQRAYPDGRLFCREATPRRKGYQIKILYYISRKAQIMVFKYFCTNLSSKLLSDPNVENLIKCEEIFTQCLPAINRFRFYFVVVVLIYKAFGAVFEAFDRGVVPPLMKIAI